MRLEYLKDKKILILGLGKEGRDSFRFLRKLFPKKILGIADRLKIKDLRFKNVKLHLGENYLEAIKDYDVVIKSPGIPIHLPEVEKAFEEGKINSQTEIFFENCPGKIIGVTGTKGKGTTASLIYKILKEGKIKAHLIGNIEKPVLHFLLHAKSPTSLRPSGSALVCEWAHTNKSNDVYVFELSSHQLYKLRKSPQIAVFLNLYPAHLDFFKNFREYISAKANITRYQNKNDYLIYNPKDKIVREIAKKTKAKKIPINPTDYEFKRITNKIGKIPLVGKFNLLNLAAAIVVGKIFNVKDKDIIGAIKKFKSLPHRLEFFGIFKGIKFYNDSLATIPESSVFAIEALGKNVQTIILGGSESNVDSQKVAKKVLESNIKNVILFPTTGQKIWKALRLAQHRTRSGARLAQGKKLPKHFFVNNMADAIKLAYQWTGKGKICLLSPAYPSFSLFRDYKQRGNLFKKYVKKYAKGK